MTCRLFPFPYPLRCERTSSATRATRNSLNAGKRRNGDVEKRNGEVEPEENSEMAPLVLGVAATAVYLHRMANMREREVDLRSVNSATYTFIWIAASYTMCNALSLFVSVLERLPGKPLLYIWDEEWQMPIPNEFYVLTTDIVSFLFMFCSFLRPIIYVKFNTQIRIDWQRNCRKPL